MATSGNRRHSNNKRKAATGKKKNEVSLFTEIIVIVIVVLSILVFLSNLGIGGTLGEYISAFFFGIFGLVEYVFPLILIIMSFFIAANKGNMMALLKMFVLAAALIFLCGFIALVSYGEACPSVMGAYWNGYHERMGGGLLGGLFTTACVKNVGLAGSFVISIAGIIICSILVTERSLYQVLRRSGLAMSEKSKEISDKEKVRRREKKELKQQQEALSSATDSVLSYEKEEKRRRNKKACGIDFDTKIREQESRYSQDMSELHSNIPYEVDVDNNILFKDNSTKNLNRIEETKPMEETFLSEKDNVTSKPLRRQKSMPINVKEEPKEVKEFTVETKEETGDYVYPPISLLKRGNSSNTEKGLALQKQTAIKLEQTLRNFGVNVTVTDVSCGPSVTRFELQPELGVKVSKIVGLADDIKLNLAAADIRIEAPIPGKAAVGIEVPNKENVTVMLRELFESDAFKKTTSKIPFSAGKDIGGQVIISDIGKMPHVLIAGSTGSGKSVCINTIVMSILYKARPDEVKLIMIDPKVVELSVYNGIPHLMIPVVTDPKKAAGALNWAVVEMTERYQKFANANVRDLKGYNQHVEKYNKENVDVQLEKMPQIVIIVDELADLMMVAPGDVEDAICRLAQLARAAGIHLILATQRPSVNVITGLIKANMPSRVAFAVSSGVDSRTILDMNGAEKLLGKGDMLFYPQGYQKPLRVQGAFVSDQEVSDVVQFLKEHHASKEDTSKHQEIEEKMNAITLNTSTLTPSVGAATDDGRDVYFSDAAKLLIEKERGSIGILQRNFKIGFNRAARIMDQLEEAGVVGPEEGTKPRKILLTLHEFESMMDIE